MKACSTALTILRFIQSALGSPPTADTWTHALSVYVCLHGARFVSAQGMQGFRQGHAWGFASAGSPRALAIGSALIALHSVFDSNGVQLVRLVTTMCTALIEWPLVSAWATTLDAGRRALQRLCIAHAIAALARQLIMRTCFCPPVAGIIAGVLYGGSRAAAGLVILQARYQLMAHGAAWVCKQLPPQRLVRVLRVVTVCAGTALAVGGIMQCNVPWKSIAAQLVGRGQARCR